MRTHMGPTLGPRRKGKRSVPPGEVAATASSRSRASPLPWKIAARTAGAAPRSASDSAITRQAAASGPWRWLTRCRRNRSARSVSRAPATASGSNAHGACSNRLAAANQSLSASRARSIAAVKVSIRRTCAASAPAACMRRATISSGIPSHPGVGASARAERSSSPATNASVISRARPAITGGETEGPEPTTSGYEGARIASTGGRAARASDRGVASLDVGLLAAVRRGRSDISVALQSRNLLPEVA